MDKIDSAILYASGQCQNFNVDLAATVGSVTFGLSETGDTA